MEGYKHPIPEGQLPLYLWLASKRQFQTWVGVGSGLPTDCKCEPSQLQLSFDHAPSYSHELFKSTLVSVKEYGYLHYMYVLQRNEMNEIGAEAASKDKGKEEKGIVFSRETGGWGSGGRRASFLWKYYNTCNKLLNWRRARQGATSNTLPPTTRHQLLLPETIP